MRNNLHKDKILAQLEKAHMLSIADLQQAIPGADFSTIFRNIEKLVEEGIVKRIVLDKNTVMYELDDPKHRHGHFYCNDCGKVESLVIPAMVAKGKTVDDVLVKGSCEDCE